MNALYWLLLVVGGCFLALVAAAAVALARERRIIPNCYAWLEVLSHVEWRGRIKLNDAMCKLKGVDGVGSRLFLVIYPDLERLLMEGLVEKNLQIHTHHTPDGDIVTTIEVYRLTPTGLKKRSERSSAEQIDLRNTVTA